MTRNELRDGLNQRIETGLVPFLMQTEMAEKIKVKVDKSETPKTVTPTEDPWKSWIFEIYAGGDYEVETSKSRTNMRIGMEGDRVTEQWRIRTDINLNYSESRFNID